MGYSLRVCTLYPYTYRIVVTKRWKQCPIASSVVSPRAGDARAEFKDGEPPQTGLGENFRDGGVGI